MRVGENIQNKARRDSKMENKKEEQRDIKDKMKMSKLHLIKCRRRERRGTKAMFKVIMT